MTNFARVIAVLSILCPSTAASSCVSAGTCSDEGDLMNLIQVKKHVQHGSQRGTREDLSVDPDSPAGLKRASLIDECKGSEDCVACCNPQCEEWVNVFENEVLGAESGRSNNMPTMRARYDKLLDDEEKTCDTDCQAQCSGPAEPEPVRRQSEQAVRRERPVVHQSEQAVRRERPVVHQSEQAVLRVRQVCPKLARRGKFTNKENMITMCCWEKCALAGRTSDNGCKVGCIEDLKNADAGHPSATSWAASVHDTAATPLEHESSVYAPAQDPRIQGDLNDERDESDAVHQAMAEQCPDFSKKKFPGGNAVRACCLEKCGLIGGNICLQDCMAKINAAKAE